MSQQGAMAVILAAGEGKRMRSPLPKVLHEVAGEPLLARVGRAARDSGAERIVVVVGKGGDRVREAFAREGWEFVVQEERLGTGDAVKRARSLIEGFEGEVLVLAGDVPLLRGSTLAALLERHRVQRASVSVLTARLEDAAGYGRILRAANSGEFLRIVEECDATEEERLIREVNSGTYCFASRALISVLDRFSRDNAQGEEYLTEAVEILRRDGHKVLAVPAASWEEILGVNTPEQLRRIEEILSAEGPTRVGRRP